jgi:outer membrane protein assembly factor BamA
MKKALLFLFISALALSVTGQEKKIKTGWKFGGALPAITFDSDLGFQYGALVEFYNYGDGSRYPDFFDHIYMEASRFTKGSGIYRMMFESNHIIPGVHWTSDLSYLPDQANHFYGFNGYESVFHQSWMNEDDPEYKTRMFYRFERNQFRFKNDFQGILAGEHFKWTAGFAFQKFSIGSVDIEKLNKGKDVLLPTVDEEPGLFELYQEWNIIPEDETSGGWVNTLKAGVAWDSRDNRPNPMKGLWTETGFELAPKFMGNDWGFAKFYFTHRQYFTLVEDDLALVYRLGYQTTVGGHSPFFYQSQLITSMLTGATSEGLGGASSLRGVLRNRVIGDGFFYGNVELRWKPLRFNLFNQDIYIGLNAFYDFGRVTDPIDLPSNLPSQFITQAAFYQFFNPGGEKLHQSAGISIMPVMNQNFVIAVDIGKAFNSQDGNIGFSIGLNYLF